MGSTQPSVRPILIPEMHSLHDVRQVLSQQLQTLQQQFIAALPISDFNGDRVTNIGDPQQLNDAVNLRYLQSVINNPFQVLNAQRGTGGGGISTAGLNQITVTSTPYTVSTTDEVITCGSGASVVNLPSLASLPSRKVLYLLNVSGGTLTVNPFSGDTIGGLSVLSLVTGAYFQLIPNA